MTRRYELTDEQFALIADLLPPNGQPGRPVERPPHHPRRHPLGPPHRRPVARAARALRPVEDASTTGFNRWRKRRHVRPHPRAAAPGAGRARAGSTATCAASTAARSGPAGRRPGPCGGKRSAASRPTTPWAARRGGFGTKLHLVCDGHGLPLAAVDHAGPGHESKPLEPVLEAVRLRRPRPGPAPAPAEAAGRGQGRTATRGSAATCGAGGSRR